MNPFFFAIAIQGVPRSAASKRPAFSAVLERRWLQRNSTCMSGRLLLASLALVVWTQQLSGTLDDRSLTGSGSGTCILSFGKHRGKRVCDVPRPYLEWVVREKVYVGREALTAALVSLKILGFPDQHAANPAQVARGNVSCRSLPDQNAANPAQVAHSNESCSEPMASHKGVGEATRVRPSDQRPGARAPLRGSPARLQTPEQSITLDNYFKLTSGEGNASTDVPRISPSLVERPGAGVGRLSMELLTPRHLVLYGLSSIGEQRISSALQRLLRQLPYAVYNASARGWSVRVEDYPKLISAIKGAGVRVSARAKDSSGDTPECMDRPPEGLVKALASQPWPLLQPNETSVRMQRIPPDLRSSLLPFQADGVWFAISRGGRVLLGDEMGLGKTVQAIAVASAFREDWPLLIVCPSSLRLNWKHELSAWLPGEDVKVLLTGVEACKVLDDKTLPNVTIISYDLLAVAHRKLSRLPSRFKILIADESHYVRNGQSARCRAVAAVAGSAARVLLLSGTPALSRPSELFTQLHFLQPKMFHSKKAFEERYVLFRRPCAHRYLLLTPCFPRIYPSASACLRCPSAPAKLRP